MALPRRLPLTRPQQVFKKITEMFPGMAAVSYLEWLSNEYTTIGLDNISPPLKAAMDLVGIKIVSEAFSVLHTAATQEKPWEAFKDFLAEAGHGSTLIGCLKEITKYVLKVSLPLAATAAAYGFTVQAISRHIQELIKYLMEHPEETVAGAQSFTMLAFKQQVLATSNYLIENPQAATAQLGSYMLASVILTNPQSYYLMISLLQTLGEAGMNALIQCCFPSPAQLIEANPVLSNAQKVGQYFLAAFDVSFMQQLLTLAVTNVGPAFLKEWRYFAILPLPLAALLRGIRYLSTRPEPIEQMINEHVTPVYHIQSDEEQPLLMEDEAAPSGCDKAGIVAKKVGKELVLEVIAASIATLISLPLTPKISLAAAKMPYSAGLFMASLLPTEGLRYLSSFVSMPSCSGFFSKKDPVPAAMAVNDDEAAISMEDIENDAVTQRRCWGLC